MSKRTKKDQLDCFLENIEINEINKARNADIKETNNKNTVNDTNDESKTLKSKVISFLKENPNPNDNKVHDWAEAEGLNVPEIEAVFYSLASDFVNQDKKI